MGTSPGEGVRTVAYRSLQGTVQDHQGSRLEVESLFHMDPGRQGRREGSHLVGTVLAVESWAALVAGAVGLVVRPDAIDLAVPIAQAKLASENAKAEQQVACG